MPSTMSAGGSPLRYIQKISQEERSKTQKKLIKDVQSDSIQVLNGNFKPHIKLNKFDDDEKDKEKPVYTY